MRKPRQVQKGCSSGAWYAQCASTLQVVASLRRAPSPTLPAKRRFIFVTVCGSTHMPAMVPISEPMAQDSLHPCLPEAKPCNQMWTEVCGFPKAKLQCRALMHCFRFPQCLRRIVTQRLESFFLAYQHLRMSPSWPRLGTAPKDAKLAR